MTTAPVGHHLTASVIICAYTEARWPTMVGACQEVVRQLRPGDELLLVVDHNPALSARAREHLSSVEVVDSEQPRGLSGARNQGVEAAGGDVVVFLDDDAVPEPGWLQALVEPYVQPEVVGVGGVARPVFLVPRPRWLPSEFLWVVGCSYTGLPLEQKPIRNPIGANMSFRRRAFSCSGGFSTELGRVGTLPVGCEETEFAIRVRRHLPHTTVVQQPAAAVRHDVPAARTTLRYFVSRCWSEGVSKAAVSRLQGSSDALEAERAYTAQVLPRAVLRGVADGVRGDLGGLQRAAATVLGLVVTAAGYLRGLVRG